MQIQLEQIDNKGAFFIEEAGKNNLLILPLCPFAKSVFDRSPEFADVLKK